MNKLLTFAAAIASVVVSSPLTQQGPITPPKHTLASMYKKNADGSLTKVENEEPKPISIGVERSHAKLKDGRLL